MNIQLEFGWETHLQKEFEKLYFRQLSDFIRQEIQTGKTIFPFPQDIFSAFNLCPFENVKVVILGQDPYHSVSVVNGKKIPTAHGLCFSVAKGAKTPPSLQNIYKELRSDLGAEHFTIPDHGNLELWAKQGVLLLNATLTVEAHKAMSHAGRGWEDFTDTVIRKVSDHHDHLVFLLWGRHARAKKSLIDISKHIVLESPHPSPFSAASGFFGCRHFSRTNAALKRIGKKPIEWQV